MRTPANALSIGWEPSADVARPSIYGCRMPTPRVAPNGPADVVEHITPGTQLVVPLANGEPTAVLDAIEAAAAAGDPRIDRVSVHQMHAIHERPYLAGEFGGRLEHVSYFLSNVTRPHFAAGTIGLVPAHFSEVYQVMRTRMSDPLVLAAASPPDAHGYFSLGVSADYTASFIGRGRFFLEVTDHMPRTFGRNQLHVSQVVGWCRTDRPLVDVPPVQPVDTDRTIAAYVAERIPDGATIQTGIGAIPNAIMASLRDHRDLGVHTELLSDGVVELIESGVVNGVRKRLNRTKTVGTFALGTTALNDFLHENTAVELHAVRYVNDPRIIANEDNFVSINATLTVDFLGQCASETIGGHYYSSTGGQNDFARGAMYSDGGQGFVVLHSTTSSGASRIVPQLAAGDVVTTPKNTVDKIVTEWGVAELRGRSIRERTRSLIGIAHPDHRDDLTATARALNYL
jgi:acyl-CoA hydrolase